MRVDDAARRKPRSLALPAISIVADLLLAGCGGGSGGALTSTEPRSASVQLSDGLTGTIAEDRSTVAVDRIVTYTLTLTNPTAQPVTYRRPPGDLPDDLPAAVTVTNAQGEVIYPVVVTEIAFPVGPPETLMPGQSVSNTIAVGGAGLGGYSAPGRYQAVAAFSVDIGETGNALASATTGPLVVEAQ